MKTISPLLFVMLFFCGSVRAHDHEEATSFGTIAENVSEANRVGGKNFVFRHTVAEIASTEGEKLWGEALARS